MWKLPIIEVYKSLVFHFFQVSFVAIVGSGSPSDIAVDELSIQAGACTASRLHIMMAGLTSIVSLLLLHVFYDAIIRNLV